jgi:serine/threonine protein phosphatase PrpC
MAATLVVLLIRQDQAIWGHVGDSRLYLFRQGRLLLQTKDHSVPQMLVGEGEMGLDEIRGHPDRSRLLRALGDGHDEIRPRLQAPFALQPADAFLLCSDGFWEYVLEAEMETALAEAEDPDQWLRLMQQRYLLPAVERERLAEAKERADNDNYSALAVWLQGEDAPLARGIKGWLGRWFER